MEELYDTTDATNPWWKYPVTGDENETDQFGGTSAAYNRGALALAALRSTVGDAKFREIEKTWVQEHQEQFDPTGLKITATYSDKSTKAIDAAERRVQPAVQDRRQHGSDHSPGGTRTADGRRQRGPVWLFAAWLRRERSLWGNAVAVLATSMMTVVIASFGDRLPPLCGAGGSQVSCDAVAQYRQGIRALPDWRSWADVQAWWPAYSVPKAALTAAIVFALTQYGSVLFVKTMIREYGKRSYLVASWVWHAALAITGFAVNMWLGVVAVVLLTRSVAIPLRFRGQRRPKPMIAGVTEAMCLLLVFIAAIIICPHLA